MILKIIMLPFKIAAWLILLPLKIAVWIIKLLLAIVGIMTVVKILQKEDDYIINCIDLKG